MISCLEVSAIRSYHFSDFFYTSRLMLAFSLALISSDNLLFAQSPMYRLERIIELYEEGDYHSLTSLLKTMKFELQTDLPSYTAQDIFHSRELIYVRPVEVTVKCFTCPTGEEIEFRDEKIIMTRTIDNNIYGALSKAQIESALDIIESNVREDRDIVAKYESTVKDQISFRDWLFSMIEKKIGNPEIPLETTNITIEEYHPFVSVDGVLDEYSKKLQRISGNDPNISKGCHISQKRNHEEIGICQYYYMYKNKSDCDQRISSIKKIVEEIWIDYAAFEKLNSSTAYRYQLLRTKLQIRNNRHHQQESFTTNYVEIEESHGTYLVPIEINEVLKIKFTFDTGAADVLISPDIALTLLKTGTLTDNDFMGNSTYTFANGKTESLKQYRLKSLKIGNKIVNNVICAVANDLNSPMLLGQSFLSRLGKFEFDYVRNRLTFK